MNDQTDDCGSSLLGHAKSNDLPKQGSNRDFIRVKD